MFVKKSAVSFVFSKKKFLSLTKSFNLKTSSFVSAMNNAFKI